MHAMHLLSCVTIRPNLELKTRPKQLLGSLPLDIVLSIACHDSATKETSFITLTPGVQNRRDDCDGSPDDHRVVLQKRLERGRRV